MSVARKTISSPATIRQYIAFPTLEINSIMKPIIINGQTLNYQQYYVPSEREYIVSKILHNDFQNHPKLNLVLS